MIIYLNNAAATPLDKEVFDAKIPFICLNNMATLY